jgi:hypothetical protein
MRPAALPRLVATTATRTTLHRLAEDVLAAEQHAANGELALMSTPDGVATGWFPSPAGVPTRIRIEGSDVVRESGAHADRESIVGPFDRTAADVLYGWWANGNAVLSALEPATGESISPVILWPEHFDIAVTLTAAGGRRMNLGFSPGDDFSSQPYVYAGPWEQLSGPFWNAPFGAFRSYEQIAAAATIAAAAFLTEARDAFGQASR